MLEQLGLGVTLTLQDNFTPGANNALKSFDALESKANATASSVSKSMMSLQNVMLAGFSFGQVGNSIENVGKQIVGVFSSLEKKMISVNSQFDTIGAQFKTIFGSANAQKMLDWSANFAIKTPFTMEDTAKAVQGISAVGLDVTKTFTNAKGEVKSFLEYVGDLATRNTGATGGMEGMKMAISNAVSGQAGGLKSLQARFDIPKADLANIAGKTGEAFQQAFVKIAEKLTPDAMRNMYGTWEQILSQMSDDWGVFLWKIGKAGVFDNVKATMFKLMYAFEDIAKQAGMMDNLKNLFNAMWKPVDMIANGVIKIAYWFNNLATYHPKLALFIEEFVAWSGVIMIATGALMKFAGGILVLVASVGSLIVNMQLMELMTAETAVASGGFMASLAGGLGIFGALALVGGGLFLGWKNDLLGLRTKSENFFDSIKRGWDNAKAYLSGGVDVFNRNVKIKLNIPPLVTFFAQKFVKIIALTKAFWEIMTGVFHGGVMSISKDNYEIYKKAGILEYVHALIYTKDKINSFFEGFASGLSSVFVIGKSLLDIVFRPMMEILKPITDAIGGIVGLTSYGKTSYSAQDAYVDFMGSGDNQKNLGRLKTDPLYAGSEAGVAFRDKQQDLYDKAQKEMGTNDVIGNKVREQVSTFGKGLGLATGALATFYLLSKTIGRLSPFSSSSAQLMADSSFAERLNSRRKFESLNNNSGVMSEAEIASQMGYRLDKNGKPIVNKAFSKDARAKAMGYLHSIDNTSTGSNHLSNLDGAYKNLSSKDVYANYYDHFLKDQLQGDQLQVKRRSGVGKFLLGEDYYAKGAGGERRNLGRWGGILRTPWDDEQMKLTATDLYAKGGAIPGTFTSKFNAQRRIITGSTLGTMANLKNTPFEEENRKIAEPYVNRIKSYKNDIKKIEEAKKLLDESLKNGSTKGMSTLMNLIGYNGKRPTSKAGLMDLFSNADHAQSVLGLSMADETHSLSGATKANRNKLHSNIYADAEQGKLSRLLFGQNIYTADKNADGTYSRTNVAKRGGIFRRQSEDYGYIDSDKAKTQSRAYRDAQREATRRYRSGSAGGRVLNTIGTIPKQARNYASGVMGEFRGELSSARAGIMGSVIGRSFGRVRGGISSAGAWGNKQLNRVGLGRVAGTQGGAGFRGLLNRGVAGTMSVGRSAISGAGRLGRGALYGAGMLGRGAMRMLPGALMLGAVGTSAVSAISAKGKEVSGGRGSGMQTFNAGLKYYQDKMSKINLSGMWNDFKKNGGSTFNIIGTMFKSMWSKLGAIMPDIMKTAFQGIRGLASLAWTWIKGDGIKLFTTLAGDAISLIGKAFTWLGTNAGKIFGGVANFVLSTVIPALIGGVLKLGVFIITHIPAILKTLVQIGSGILGGLLTIVVGIFKGIGSAIFEAIKGALSGFGSMLKNLLGGAIKAVLPSAVATPILTALGIHHKGLYMSPSEHTAIIRKDETVLPPDISKKFNDLIVRGGGKGSGGVGSSSGGGTIQVDKMEVIVKADKLSQSDARKQAIMIAKEFKKLKREKDSRSYQDVNTSGLEFY